MIKIKNLIIKNNIFLAPMAGITNYSYRRICAKYKPGLVFGEMVSAHAFSFKNKKTLELLYSKKENNILVQQIFGYDIENMLKLAKYLDKNHPCVMIDINMGCPVPKVAEKSKAGSALMKEPIHAYNLVKTIVDNVSKPVSVKIRTGWDEDNINCVSFSKLMQKAGASLITVHGRTKKQYYQGKVDYDLIKKVKESVSIPVIANGDIIDAKSAKYVLDYTGCDGIMIGRGAIGNPFIFKEIDCYLKGKKYKKPSLKKIYKTIKKHINLSLKIMPEKKVILELRMSLSKYIKGLENNAKINSVLYKIETKKELLKVLKTYFKALS